jgi:PAS domain S-box-containing protein
MLNAQEIRILIVDDDEDDYFILSDYIKEIESSKFIIDWCSDYDEALSKIRDRKYDIYFVDYRLGKHTGLELLQEVYAEDFYDPVVLLTGKGNKDIDIKAMQSGATDYLIKSELNTEKLERCIRYSLDRADDLKELKARENKYRSLFENSKDAIFIVDENLVFTEANQAASLLFSDKVKHIIGKSLFDFVKSEQQKKQVAQLAEKKENITDLQIEIENSKGESIFCLLSVSFIEGHDGGYFIHGILHDMTNIRKAEAANLQAQKLAANERLMRTLAHEIRNPLNNIGLSLDYLTVPVGEDDTQSDLVSIMQRNCVRINHIITELLDLTKPPELTFQPCSLQEILDESIAISSDRINLQKIEVEKNYPPVPLTIPANRSKLTIAFTNILINAVEAMSGGKGKLSIGVEELASRYAVSIKDNGNGIPEEYLPKLFEPFFTLKKNGVGLGLAASYAIFQSHKANVYVESKIDKGTEFVITFDRDNGLLENTSVQ